jgi:hypothetical protein
MAPTGALNSIRGRYTKQAASGKSGVNPPPANHALPLQGQRANPLEGQPPNGTESAVVAGDPKTGEVIFKQFAAWHSLDPDRTNRARVLPGFSGARRVQSKN